MGINRYKNIITTVREDGRAVYTSIRYPTIDDDPSDILLITKRGDRLDNLANRFYGDVTLWWIIAKANHVGNGSFALDPGIQLRIPMNVSKILSDLNTLNK